MRKCVVGIVLGLSLAACGGGGTVSNTQPTGTYDLQAAVTAYSEAASSVPVTLTGTAMANGTSVPFTGTGTYTAAAGASGTFNGVAALEQTVSISGTITAAGQSRPYSTSAVDAYAASSGDILGQSQSSEYDIASAPIVIPSTVSAGGQVLGTLNRYTDSTQSVALGTIQISVTVGQISGGSGGAYTAQFTYKIYDTGQNLVETDTYDYMLTAGMALTFSSAGATTSSGSVTVTSQ